MWDGAISLGRRDVKLGKIMIVLAGSNPALPVALSHARSMRSELPQQENTSSKLIDLYSRINGEVLSIPPFVDAMGRPRRKADKVMIALQLLMSRFANEEIKVPRALLHFVMEARFRYDVRSIAHMINLIPFNAIDNGLTVKRLSLPLRSPIELRDSSLAYHLVDDKDQAHGVRRLWKRACACKEVVANIGAYLPKRKKGFAVQENARIAVRNCLRSLKTQELREPVVERFDE